MTRTDRRGYALIEMLVVIALVTVMMTLVAGLIHLLLKLDRSGRDASDLSVDVARLAEDFRSDVHRALAFEPKPQAAQTWVFRLEAGRTVEYQVRPDDLLRTEFDGEKVRRRESYRRPRRSTITINRSGEPPRPLVTLTLDRPTDGREDALYRDYRIVAGLGRDRPPIARPQ